MSVDYGLWRLRHYEHTGANCLFIRYNFMLRTLCVILLLLGL